LRREDVPLQGDLYRDGLRYRSFRVGTATITQLQGDPDYERLRYPLSVDPSRLPLIADWHALVCRKRSGDDAIWMQGLAQSLLEIIVAFGGESALHELRRLQESHAYPGVEWLSHAMLRIEDHMLAEGAVSWEGGPLLDIVNKQSLGIIASERDLFEWVCQALDEVQEALEQRAEGVAGFWRGEQPKPEPWCQNVLWPLLQLTLQKFGIAASVGEEKVIQKNRCDFWVEYPRKGAPPFRVGIELKIARKQYGPKELLMPIETQLWKKYLRPSGCRHGVFIVLWFRDDRRYHGPSAWPNRETLAEELRKKCEEVTKRYQVSMASYVIDVTTPFRER
jgi:hypothetical protein